LVTVSRDNVGFRVFDLFQDENMEEEEDEIDLIEEVDYFFVI